MDIVRDGRKLGRVNKEKNARGIEVNKIQATQGPRDWQTIYVAQ